MPGVLDKGTLVGVDNYIRDTSICECIGTHSLLSQYFVESSGAHNALLR